MHINTNNYLSYARGVPESLQRLSRYTLVICEKPDAAKRVAEALGEGKVIEEEHKGVHLFIVEGKEIYVVCSALGHLYTVADPTLKRTAYPILDVEWFPTYMVDSAKSNVIEKRIAVIRSLSERASRFINACDYDLEGETIGYNILKYACGGKEDGALRAKFSTLTHDELKEAFSKVAPEKGNRLSCAGRTRHVIDFIWGVNLSRALSEAFYQANKRYKMISIGRVQGPTLSYVVNREVEIKSFVPTPYWTVDATFEKDGASFKAEFEKQMVKRLKDAEAVVEACRDKVGEVSSIRKSIVHWSPPTPFNIGDLQREAYRVFGYPPSQTLGIAERLYLEALISYPRTSSQRLPPVIGYSKIFAGLSQIRSYRIFCQELTKGPLKPHEGEKSDPAHPAIYPTGEVPRRTLDARENRVYDLIVKRFLSVFAEEALRERVSATIEVDGYAFKLSGRRTIREGWLRYYREYSDVEDISLPSFEEGEKVKVLEVRFHEKFEQPSSRYNQSSLLERMEEDGLGTKTTRAEVISTLYSRGYISGESMLATDIGFEVVEAMRRYSPNIISVEMTRDIERSIEGIEAGDTEEEEVIEAAIERLVASLRIVKDVEKELGSAIRQAMISTIRAQNILGPCPLCKTGKLTVIRSRRTGKRFVGCTNYRGGCRASAPLPQRGFIKTTTKLCPQCMWPIIYVKLSRIPWKLCVNVDCPTKEGRGRKVPAVQ